MADILVIDDDELLAEAVGQMLTDRGHRVHLAFNGLTGLEQAKRQKPDLVILDMSMPDLDGVQVARRLRLDLETCAIPIIALTALDQAVVYDHLAAIDAYVSKPLDTALLATRVKEFVRP